MAINREKEASQRTNEHPALRVHDLANVAEDHDSLGVRPVMHNMAQLCNEFRIDTITSGGGQNT
jgi:hypothetical protein